jgi:hypothetical protein
VHYEERKINFLLDSKHWTCWIYYLYYVSDPRGGIYCFLAHRREIYPKSIYFSVNWSFLIHS